MDFEGAILAHSRWKRRLQASLGGGERLDPVATAGDHHCDLGKWLHGEGKVHAAHPAYQALLSEHAAFHRAAAAVVERINAGDTAGATELLTISSEFSRASGSVVQSITRIRDSLSGTPASASASKG
jgi:hypothetical protein